MVEPTVNVAKAEMLAAQYKSGKLTREIAKQQMIDTCGLTAEKAEQQLVIAEQKSQA